jgi:hypothetical protein
LIRGETAGAEAPPRADEVLQQRLTTLFLFFLFLFFFFPCPVIRNKHHAGDFFNSLLGG